MKNIIASGNLFGEHVTLQQISKKAALKLFSDGIEIYLQSSNMHPFSMWQTVCSVKIDLENLASEKEHEQWCINGGYKLPVYPATEKGQFDNICTSYEVYNCDSERGRYIHYYKTI